MQGGDTGRGDQLPMELLLPGKILFSAASRKDVVSVVSTYQYPDPEDVFSREPFVVKFSVPSCGELILPTPRQTDLPLPGFP